jgi:hypothetical protein
VPRRFALAHVSYLRKDRRKEGGEGRKATKEGRKDRRKEEDK